MQNELAENPNPPRRGRRFLTYRIRTLLVLVAVAAVALVLYRAYVLEPYRQQQEFLADIAKIGGSVKLERIGGGKQRDWTDDSELGLLDRIVEVDLFHRGWRKFGAGTIGKESEPDFGAIIGLIRPAIAIPSDYDRPQVIARCLHGLRGLPGLRRLSLRYGHNNVSDASLAALRGLTQLEHLDLTMTSVRDAGLVHLRNLTGLKHLSLANCWITDEGLVELSQLPNLETLDLGSMHVTGVGLRALWGDRRLRRLALDRTDVVELELQSMPALEILHVCRTPLERVRLIGVDNLRVVDLSYTKVTDDTLQALREATSLEEIDLTGTSVRGEGLQYLAGLPRLRVVKLGPWSEADADRALEHFDSDREVKFEVVLLEEELKVESVLDPLDQAP